MKTQYGCIQSGARFCNLLALGIVLLTFGKLATNAHDFFIYHLKPLIQSCLVKVCTLVQTNIRIGCLYKSK